MDDSCDGFVSRCMRILVMHDGWSVFPPVGVANERSYPQSPHRDGLTLASQRRILARFLSMYPAVAERISDFIGAIVIRDDPRFEHEVRRIADFLNIIMISPILTMGMALRPGYDDVSVMRAILSYSSLMKRSASDSTCRSACEHADITAMASYVDMLEISDETLHDIASLMNASYTRTGIGDFLDDVVLDKSSWRFIDLLASYPHGLSYQGYMRWRGSESYRLLGYPCASMHTHDVMKARYHACVMRLTWYVLDTTPRMSDYVWFANMHPEAFPWLTFKRMAESLSYDMIYDESIMDAGVTLSIMCSRDGSMGYALLCASRLLSICHGSASRLDYDDMQAFVDDVNGGMPLECALECVKMRSF